MVSVVPSSTRGVMISVIPSSIKGVNRRRKSKTERKYNG
jgi:hypothetical protein